LSLGLFAFISLSAFAQNAERLAPLTLQIGDQQIKHRPAAKQPVAHGLESPIWSEDFASGIPSTWINQGRSGGVVNSM